MQPPQPYIPKHIAFFFKNKNGPKGLYGKLKVKKLKMEFQIKWHDELNLNLDYTSWQYIFNYDSNFKRLISQVVSVLNIAQNSSNPGASAQNEPV